MGNRLLRPFLRVLALLLLLVLALPVLPATLSSAQLPQQSPKELLKAQGAVFRMQQNQSDAAGQAPSATRTPQPAAPAPAPAAPAPAAILPPPAAAPGPCVFQLGFAALRDQIPTIVGSCIENEWHNAENGDALQQTTGGLMAWRKADNWTAFTNGSMTWINGPCGLQSRPNDQRFSWEGRVGASC